MSRLLFPPLTLSLSASPFNNPTPMKQISSKTMAKRSYWLLKTEPSEWSWDDQRRSDGGVSRWDGVRNRQAQKNLKSMNIGDLCFFYHSGRERSIIGVVEIVRTWFSTSGDGGKDWEGAVDVRMVSELQRTVNLTEIKAEIKAEAAEFKDFALLRQPRLSVLPVAEKIWDRICEMGLGFAGSSEDRNGGDEEVSERKVMP